MKICLEKIDEFCKCDLKLVLKPAVLGRCVDGVSFLGEEKYCERIKCLMQNSFVK